MECFRVQALELASPTTEQIAYLLITSVIGELYYCLPQKVFVVARLNELMHVKSLVYKKHPITISYFE